MSAETCRGSNIVIVFLLKSCIFAGKVKVNLSCYRPGEALGVPGG
jgi:hypothetical protein